MQEPDHETILVVDDQDAVRRLVCRILASKGHKLLDFQDGNLAIRHCRAPNSIGLAVIDLTMPTIDGLTLSKKLRELHPKLPVVLMTGFDIDDVLAAEEEIKPRLGYLEKPFKIDELLNALDHARALAQS